MIDVDKFIRRMYRVLDQRPEIFVIKKMKKERGYCMDDKSEVAVDHRDEILSTLVHEMVHYLEPKWSEAKVLRAEKYIMNKVTPRRAANILKRFIKTQ